CEERQFAESLDCPIADLDSQLAIPTLDEIAGDGFSGVNIGFVAGLAVDAEPVAGADVQADIHQGFGEVINANCELAQQADELANLRPIVFVAGKDIGAGIDSDMLRLQVPRLLVKAVE